MNHYQIDENCNVKLYSVDPFLHWNDLLREAHKTSMDKQRARPAVRDIQLVIIIPSLLPYFVTGVGRAS